MKRTVSVVAAASGAVADVRLHANRTLGEVLPQLMRLTGSAGPPLLPGRAAARPGPPPPRAGGALDPSLPVAHLRDGDELRLAVHPVPPTVSALRVEITAGPDAGAGVDLPPGRCVLGRGADGLSLTDPQLSRQHLELLVAADGSVVVTDLASTNGTSLDDVPLPAHQPTPWPPGAVLRAGATTLVHGRTNAAAATAVSPDGTTIVNRPPRLPPGGAPPVVVVFPSPPTPATTGRLPLLASLAPLL